MYCIVVCGNCGNEHSNRVQFTSTTNKSANTKQIHHNLLLLFLYHKLMMLVMLNHNTNCSIVEYLKSIYIHCKEHKYRKQSTKG